jgi:uncharacterized protein
LRPGVYLGGARIRLPSVGKPGHTPGNVKLLLPPRQSRGNSRCINLAGIYDQGQGITQDYVEAIRMYRLVAAQGDAVAQLNLGLMYLKGHGVTQDYVRSHMWFNPSAAAGLEPGVRMLDLASRLMPRQQIAEAQILAKECQHRNFYNCE